MSDTIVANDIEMKIMRGEIGVSKNRRANAVVFGFDFQVNAAIVLMLENIEELKSLRLEGNYEDIELELENNQYILAQAKAVERASSDFKNVRSNLKKALISLSEGATRVNVQKLILITNSPNPLNENESSNLFLRDAHRDFSSLPESSQELIQGYLSEISNPLDTNKFMIQILPFETDNDTERYKFVRQYINDFVGDINVNIPGLEKKLMDIWHNEVFQNCSKKDVAIKLKKGDIIWPIIVIATDISRYDDVFVDLFDSSEYDEIIHHYQEIIDTHCERCEFFTKVLSDYNTFNFTKKPSEKIFEFLDAMWIRYIDEFDNCKLEPGTLEGLIKIVLYTIVRNRITIDKIKKGVKLC